MLDRVPSTIYQDSSTLEPIFTPLGPPTNTYLLFGRKSTPTSVPVDGIIKSTSTPVEEELDIKFNLALSPIHDDQVAGPQRERKHLSMSPVLPSIAYSSLCYEDKQSTTENQLFSKPQSFSKTMQPPLKMSITKPNLLRVKIPESKRYDSPIAGPPVESSNGGSLMLPTSSIELVSSGWVFHNQADSKQHTINTLSSPNKVEKIEIRKAVLKKKPYEREAIRKDSDEDDEDSCDSKRNKFKHGAWSKEEHDSFLRGLNECGHCWKKIASEYVKTRDRSQIASHAQKVRTGFSYINIFFSI